MTYNQEKLKKFICYIIQQICDIEIFRKTSSIPSSHENRFRTLENKFPHLYRVVDKDFPYYTDSYRIIISKRIVDLVKEDVEKFIKEFES